VSAPHSNDICACGDYRFEHDSITGQCRPCAALGNGIPGQPRCGSFRLHLIAQSPYASDELAELRSFWNDVSSINKRLGIIETPGTANASPATQERSSRKESL